ncbi:hypothetical protein DR996_14190 [Vibrio owensii]|nr:hypothetical protein [Vibrio parahaemolyticus]EGR2872007.1 hypothetical protein [Vibrio parahaemolyticus]QLK46247.1 hypothetical protein DR996_14190 [Vibrio owensii]
MNREFANLLHRFFWRPIDGWYVIFNRDGQNIEFTESSHKVLTEEDFERFLEPVEKWE